MSIRQVVPTSVHRSPEAILALKSIYTKVRSELACPQCDQHSFGWNPHPSKNIYIRCATESCINPTIAEFFNSILIIQKPELISNVQSALLPFNSTSIDSFFPPLQTSTHQATA